MKHFGKQELVGCALLICWAMIVVFTTILFVTMAETSYATTSSLQAPEPVVEEPAVTEREIVTVEYTPPYTEDEIDLIALVCMGEAEGESELGKRLVIDTILNRAESNYFPDTVEEVVYQSGQFECMWNGRIDRCDITDEVRELVISEMRSKENSDVLFFRAGYYHDFGTPVLSEGNHYFSTN